MVGQRRAGHVRADDLSADLQRERGDGDGTRAPRDAGRGQDGSRHGGFGKRQRQSGTRRGQRQREQVGQRQPGAATRLGQERVGVAERVDARPEVGGALASFGPAQLFVVAEIEQGPLESFQQGIGHQTISSISVIRGCGR
jgi:hypothetical protein